MKKIITLLVMCTQLNLFSQKEEQSISIKKVFYHIRSAFPHLKKPSEILWKEYIDDLILELKDLDRTIDLRTTDGIYARDEEQCKHDTIILFDKAKKLIWARCQYYKYKKKNQKFFDNLSTIVDLSKYSNDLANKKSNKLTKDMFGKVIDLIKAENKNGLMPGMNRHLRKTLQSDLKKITAR